MPQRRQNSTVRMPVANIFGINDFAIALFHQQTRHVAPAEIDRERKPDRAATDDQHRYADGFRHGVLLKMLLVRF